MHHVELYCEEANFFLRYRVERKSILSYIIYIYKELRIKTPYIHIKIWVQILFKKKNNLVKIFCFRTLQSPNVIFKKKLKEGIKSTENLRSYVLI